MIILHDDSGREVAIRGDWSGRLVGADFGGDGQVLMWLKPGPDGWLEPLTRAAQLDHVRDAVEKSIAENAAPYRPPAGELPKGD